MKLHINEPLERSIEVTAKTRPIKIAYILPTDNNNENHLILDAVFYEAYTRWCGSHTLLIPSNPDSFNHQEYEHWLSYYDPDYIYSYIDLSENMIKKIATLTNPVLFLKHETKTERDDFYKYSLSFQSKFMIEPVSSISTIKNIKRNFIRKNPSTTTLLTQAGIQSNNRFVSDNFGTSYRTNGPTYPIEGLYDTLLYNPEANTSFYGTTETDSLNDILNKLASDNLKTFHELSSICDETSDKTTFSDFNHSLQLFVGDSCLDRINFWNARLLNNQIPGSLIISPMYIQDNEFISSLSNYLKNNNFLGHNNHPTIQLQSFSTGDNELKDIRDTLSKHIHSSVIMPVETNIYILPKKTRFGAYSGHAQPQKQRFKINEKITENIIAEKPYHLEHIPQAYKNLCDGQWAIDVEIERINNMSRFANIKDIWEVPKRKSISECFTDNICRINKNHIPSIIPTQTKHPIFNERLKNELNYMLISPSDNTFFRILFLGNDYETYNEDLRSRLNIIKYEELKISDKGQYLNGVISLFENLDVAYKCLTHKLWRDYIRSPLRQGKNQTETKAASSKRLYGNLERDKKLIQLIQETLRLNLAKARNYRLSNFKDSLEYLIQREVFFRVHEWRCDNCGHTNIQRISNINELNKCEICKKETHLSLDVDWKYKINDFLTKALCDNNGLTVLWALGFLHNRNMRESFFYTPEVMFYEKYRSKTSCAEIDIICVIGGKIYIAEAKKSAAAFFIEDNSTEKFISIINHLKPDVALLIFEQYCENPDDEQSFKEKIKDTIKNINEKTSGTEIRVLIASEVDTSFNEYPFSLYPEVGKRSRCHWENE